MNNDNRGAYTPPTEAPLAFDARRASGPDERPRSNMLVISAAILVVLLAAFAVFTFTRTGGGDTDDQTQTFETMKEPVQQVAVAPQADDGMTVQPVETLNPNFAPPPEQPEARPAPGVEIPPPPAPPVATTPAPKTTAPAATAPAAQPKTPAVPTKVASAAPPAPSRATSTAMVQIGAFSSAALADQEWNRVALDDPAQMAGKTKQVETIQADGQTRYRSLVGGFASRAEADAFCDRLKARGRTCFARN